MIGTAHPPRPAEDSLARAFRNGWFAVTTELNPPDSPDPEAVLSRAAVFQGTVDAINAVDASGANCHMSSLAMSAIMAQAGYAPILQIACRDRNRIAIQGDVLGAAALGIRNVLCLTGDGVQAGDQPGAKPVFDLDSASLLHMLRRMRDQGEYLSGRKLEARPDLHLGAAINPFAPPHAYRPLQLGKKIAAGADFVQSQYCFDIPRLEAFMATARDLGLDRRASLLIGVGPLASARTARWLRAHVPGVHIPDEVIGRLERARDQKAEGLQICVELIQQIREIPGIAGVHIMAYRQEAAVPDIIAASGVLRGRT